MIKTNIWCDFFLILSEGMRFTFFSRAGLCLQTDFPSISSSSPRIRHTCLPTPSEINILCDHRIRLHVLYNAFYIMHHVFSFLFHLVFHKIDFYCSKEIKSIHEAQCLVQCIISFYCDSAALVLVN